VAAVVSASGVFLVLEQVFLALAASSHDGQAGLGAFMGAFEFGILAFFVTLVGTYFVQRWLTAERRAASDEY
jgi:ABC-type Mn2+/Zn2+ transport system permease subunit